MSSDYLGAYQSLIEYPHKISYTKISKVAYLLKLKAQCNSISDLDRKHKAWGQKDYGNDNLLNIK
tara:strand:- start:349 stop:543 length:195 start_codon:yes stop_codon:yes gene_type:complete